MCPMSMSDIKTPSIQGRVEGLEGEGLSRNPQGSLRGPGAPSAVQTLARGVTVRRNLVLSTLSTHPQVAAEARPTTSAIIVRKKAIAMETAD